MNSLRRAPAAPGPASKGAQWQQFSKMPTFFLRCLLQFVYSLHCCYASICGIESHFDEARHVDHRCITTQQKFTDILYNAIPCVRVRLADRVLTASLRTYEAPTPPRPLLQKGRPYRGGQLGGAATGQPIRKKQPTTTNKIEQQP